MVPSAGKLPINSDATNLMWFIDLLNAGRQPESLISERLKPAVKERLRKKPVVFLESAPTPDELRRRVSRIIGDIVRILVYQPTPPRLQSVNRLAEQALSFPFFLLDKSGKLQVERRAYLRTAAEIFLMVDAMEVLTYLVKSGLLSRIKQCSGYRPPQYRGAPRLRCDAWFEGAPNKTYCSIRCGKRAEHLRNQEQYRVRQRMFMKNQRIEGRKEEAERSKEGRTKFNRRVRRD